MTAELKELTQKLTVANAGATALANGFTHDGNRLPGAGRTLRKVLEAAAEAGRIAEAILKSQPSTK